MRFRSWSTPVIFVATALAVFFANTPSAHAIPAFARKYQTSCLTCHTVYPVLNSFGEAFRRNGYRMPSQGGSTDTDAVKGEMIALGQEEYKEMFPQAVWPSKIMDGVPIGIVINGGVAYNFPNSDAAASAGNQFTWNGLYAEFHLFAAGAFSDTLTYYSELNITEKGVDPENAFVMWSDIVGPPHLLNLWIGKLAYPSITSFGSHSTYLADFAVPPVAVAGLYNPSFTAAIPTKHPNAVELNGIAGHRFTYALGWAESRIAGALLYPDAQDFYAHLGVKIGGMSLDGEGPCGSTVPDPMKPWEEKSVTLDAYGWSGLLLFDNGTGVAKAAVSQKDQFQVLGGQVRGLWNSLSVTAGMQVQHQDSPYQGTPGAAGPPPMNGTPFRASGNSLMGYGEIAYIVWPWFVPAVRAEYTRVDINGAAPKADAADGNYAWLTRFIPGIAMLVRPNINVTVSGELDQAYGLPPVGDWGNASGLIQPAQKGADGKYVTTKLEAEQINLTAAIGF